MGAPATKDIPKGKNEFIITALEQTRPSRADMKWYITATPISFFAKVFPAEEVIPFKMTTSKTKYL